MQHLQPNTTLQGGKYRIERVLGQGGFGITYLARNTVFDIDVAIKEFFMKDENERDGNSVTMPISTKTELFVGQKEKFKKEAKRMFAIKNEHIIGVSDLFEENGTAYYVMDYVDGENLAERLKRTSKPMTEQEVQDILPQILDALKSVHDAGIWHLDLKPANIMVDKTGNVKLIDFGASKQLNAQKGGATTSTAISYTNSYAPREQMEQNYDKFGPWTDIYALGATLYCLLTNKRPPLPSDIDDDETENKHQALPFPIGVSEDMKKLVLKLMKTNRKLRPQGVDEVLPLLATQPVKPENLVKKAVESKVEEPDDSEVTIIASSVNEKTRIEQRPKNEDDSNDEVASVIKYYNNLETESNDDDSGMTSGTKIILAILIGIIVFILIIGGKGCGNEAQIPTDQQPKENVPQDNSNEVLTQTSTVKNGYFEESYNDGSSYKGNFKNGMYHGQGTFTWANGEKYDGEWNNGNRTKGTYTWPEKRKGYIHKYVGEFRNNELEGKGTAYYVGGEIESGIWKNGVFVEDNNVKKEKNYSINSDKEKASSSYSSSESTIGSPVYFGNFKFELVSVKLEGNRTICTTKVSIINMEKDMRYFIWSDRNEFLEDSDTGERYYIVSSDIGFTRNKFEITSSCKFRYYYPSLPYKVKRINVFSGSQYFVKNYRVR